ncbi:MAG: NADP-dependent oxidoreductase [Actinomycetota bacterium]|nr:NADP-dependent oxidoreductase [Actinomycetota bacterium]
MGSDTTIKVLALEGFDRPPAVIDVPAPEPEAGEVLVRVHAASVNAFDTFVAMGMAKDFMTYEFPAVLGQDVAGVVEAIGDGVEGLRSGDRVFGTIGSKGAVHDGTFAELSTPLAPALALTPAAVDDQQAGALGVAGTTAMSAVEAIDPSRGATVLVVGATGGVGTFAIQLAAGRGAIVIATAKPGDEVVVTDLGATETVDYSNDVIAAVRERHPDGIHALIDLVNRDPGTFGALAGLVRDGGRAVSAVGGAGDATEIGGVEVRNIGSDPSHLGPLASMIEEGKLTAAIQRTYPLADAGQALTDFTNQHTVGKLVIAMPDA